MLDMTWNNFAGDQPCRPASIERPRSVAELSEVITRAGAAGRTVRPVGAGHSFGDLVPTDGTIVSLDCLRGLLHVDPAGGLVKVAAGTRLSELSLLLAEHGLAMPNLGDIDRQSVAGAVSTATHGTGGRLGNLATQIDSVELVLADGTVRAVTGGDELRAARVSLGALGVLASVTLRTVPAFTLHGVDVRRDLAETLEAVDALVDGNDHFEFFAFPHSRYALTRTNNRTDDPPRPPGRAAEATNRFVQNTLLDRVSRVGRRWPRQIPRLNRVVTRVAPSSSRTDVSYKVFASPRDVRFTESEWAVPREAGPDVVREVMATIRRRGFDVNFPLEMRFVAPDEDCFLSPSWGRATCYVAVHAYQGMAWRDYFDAVQDIALGYGGRPHWGKRHTLDAERLSGLYPQWGRFQAVRDALDPERRFANDHLVRIFG